MPSLEKDDLKNIDADNLFENFPTFVETGTYLCETIKKWNLYSKLYIQLKLNRNFI